MHHLLKLYNKLSDFIMIDFEAEFFYGKFATVTIYKYFGNFSFGNMSIYLKIFKLTDYHIN